jgi:hypothetical protein
MFCKDTIIMFATKFTGGIIKEENLNFSYCEGREIVTSIAYQYIIEDLGSQWDLRTYRSSMMAQNPKM